MVGGASQVIPHHSGPIHLVLPGGGGTEGAPHLLYFTRNAQCTPVLGALRRGGEVRGGEGREGRVGIRERRGGVQL